ncbi:M1 family metallopeptidase [Aeromicrobium sp.]
MNDTPDDYVPGHGDLAYDVLHYALELDYKVDGNRLAGRAHLSAVANEDLRRFSLDLHALRVSKVTVDGGTAKFSSRRDRILVRPKSPIAADQEFSVVVDYSGNPGPIADKVLDSAGWEELTDGVIVASQPHGAPSWFPCNDRPGNKASYRIAVTAGSDYHVVANGTLVGHRRRASSTTWVYDQPEPMAPYLATVQIGRYGWWEIEASIPMFVAVPKRIAINYDKAFDDQPRMVAFFARLFGPYPFASYTVVVTDDVLEIPLEAQGMSTFGSNHLRRDWEAVRLVAHELSHQWFGNSLTVEHWKDIWMHEGFACYAEWLWSQESGGKTTHAHAVHHWTRLSRLGQNIILADPGPDLMFDDRIYKRGALLLHALRLTLGDEVFFDLLRAWASAHAGGTVSTTMFIDFAVTTTGVDLAELFDAWLNQAALPALPALPPQS